MNSHNDRKENIILIGFMGSGKTSIGAVLSEKLGLPLYDTDSMIEESEGMSISSIFAEKGEAAFRDMETQLLKKIYDEDAGRAIYSLGGGTPLRDENAELIKKCGTVFYLRAKAGTIYERLKDDDTRPLLRTEDPRSRIEELLTAREPKYRAAADHYIDTDGETFEVIAEKIIGFVKNS